MSQPTAYEPAHEFLTDEGQNPQFPGSELDIEFAALDITLTEILANLVLIQRDDGALKNGIVTVDSLSDAVAAMIGDADVLAELEADFAAVEANKTAAAASATAAAASASAASTSASAAATSATSASSSASTATTQASNASTSATNAATSATNAATSATSAATQATNAASSATAAASSATAAAASFDAFDDIYLGAKAADPTLDNDGNALQTGALYWNTGSSALKVYDGAAWQVYSPVAGAPSDADYLVKTSNAGLSAERVVTDVSSAGGIVVDWATAGQAKFKSYASGADKMLYSTGANAWAETDITAAGRALLDDAAASNQRTTLGLGTAAVKNTGTSGDAVPLLNTANDWSSAHQYSALATLTDGANIDWAVNTKQKAKVTLGGNRTMNATTGAVEGGSYWLWVVQDGTGSRTITWTTSGSGSFDFGADGAPTLTTTASKADLLCFEAISIGGTLKLRFCGSRKGFA